MGTVVENIRKIGIFMIAAQAVMLFAPGKQYEKYIKLIAGVMVLLQFVNPFAGIAEDFEKEWETGMEQMIQQLDESQTGQGSLELSDSTGLWNAALQQIEGEVQSRLNLALGQEPYRVAEVHIQLGQTTDASEENREWAVEYIQVVMEKKSEWDNEESDESGMIPIEIEEIAITSEQERKENEEEGTGYASLFADTLGMEEDRVEVTCRGGW